MPVFKVPRDTPHDLSCFAVILVDLNYGIGSFEGFVTKDTNYVTWFLQSLVVPIIDDCLVSDGRVLDGIACALQALEAHLRLHVDTLYARMKEREGMATTRDGYVQEEIARSLAREREAHVVATWRERPATS